MTNNRIRDIMLYGAWALIAIVGGVLLQAEAALIALVATLPLSVLGLSDLLMQRPTRPEPPAVESDSFVPPVTPIPVEPPTARSPVPLSTEPSAVTEGNTPPRGTPTPARRETIGQTVDSTGLIQELRRLISGLQTVVIQQSGSLGEQAQALKSVDRTMTELNGFISQARREAVRLAASGSQTRTALQNGREAIGGTLNGLTVTSGQVEQTIAALTELAKHVRRTGQIISAVNEIATQSNFLALNAAIEAARADNPDSVNASSGRAFATVAEEVRALAEQSRATVAQLRTALVDAQHALEHATEVVEIGNQQVGQSVTSARQLESIFGKLVEAIDETESAAQRIVVVVDRESGGLESLAETINDSSRFAEQARVSLQLVDTATRDLERAIREPELAV